MDSAWPDNVTSTLGRRRDSGAPEGDRPAGADRAQSSLRQAELRMRLLTTRVCMLSWSTDADAARHLLPFRADRRGSSPRRRTWSASAWPTRCPAPAARRSRRTSARSRARPSNTRRTGWAAASRRAWSRCATKRGAVVGTVGAAIDVTEVKRAQDELLRSTLRDGLTGLPNRTGFLEVLDRAVARPGAATRCCS